MGRLTSLRCSCGATITGNTVHVAYRNLRQHTQNQHKVEEGKVETAVDFPNMSHKQVVEYFVNNSSKIESGLIILTKEFPIYKGRIDLLGRDAKHKICLIEIAHRSNRTKEYWTTKLKTYLKHMLWIERTIFYERNAKTQFRLLLLKPGHPVEEIPNPHGESSPFIGSSPLASSPPYLSPQNTEGEIFHKEGTTHYSKTI